MEVTNAIKLVNESHSFPAHVYDLMAYTCVTRKILAQDCQMLLKPVSVVQWTDCRPLFAVHGLSLGKIRWKVTVVIFSSCAQRRIGAPQLGHTLANYHDAFKRKLDAPYES